MQMNEKILQAADRLDETLSGLDKPDLKQAFVEFVIRSAVWVPEDRAIILIDEAISRATELIPKPVPVPG